MTTTYLERYHADSGETFADRQEYFDAVLRQAHERQAAANRVTPLVGEAATAATAQPVHPEL